MTITFVRHAEVQEQYIGKYNGHIDIGLSKNGLLQAKELADKLKAETFDAIYCSDLIRARETLGAFKLNMEVIFTDKLREKSWGIHEGRSFQEIENSGIKYENFTQWVYALDGENIDTYKENVKKLFYEVLLKTEGNNILVITHSGFIKTLISIVKNLSLEKSFQTSLPYASVFKFYLTSSPSDISAV